MFDTVPYTGASAPDRWATQQTAAHCGLSYNPTLSYTALLKHHTVPDRHWQYLHQRIYPTICCMCSIQFTPFFITFNNAKMYYVCFLIPTEYLLNHSGQRGAGEA